MTILTKPFSEKKGDKLVTPLVVNEQIPPPASPEDGSLSHVRVNRIIFFPRGVDGGRRRITTSTTLCLLLTALLVVGIGIIGGKILYDQYLKVSHKPMAPERIRFDEFARIPLSDDGSDIEIDRDQDSFIDKLFPTENYPEDVWSDEEAQFRKIFLKDFFQEKFEINDDEKYEKIDVPDFRDGRSGRFIHDFNTNTTGIIDITGRRCFVMPLSRENVLPPKSLFDLIHKMWDGYYKVNTAVVRRNMRVILPALNDTKAIGSYISSECEELPIYKLEKYVGGVVKRSAELHKEAQYAQFAGDGITQIDIMNLDEVIAYEKEQQSH